MYDRILAQGFIPPSWADPLLHEQFQVMRTEILRTLRNAKVFNVDNVAEYVYTSPWGEGWKLIDFPNLAPPFPVFFMEIRSPRQMLSKVDGQFRLVPSDIDFCGWGVLLIGDEIAPLNLRDPNLSHDQRERFDFSPECMPTPLQSTVSSDAKTSKWRLRALLFVEEHRGHIFGPVILWEWEVDAKGVHSWGPNIGGMPAPLGTPETEYWQWLSEGWSPLLYPAFLAISFLHCKNVKVERENPPQKLSRAFQRRHGHPLTQFHTLQITPMRKVLEREGQSESLGLKKALHICRGHFKTFTPDRKLFGRHIGTYWWDAHVRGTTEQGIALKDYQVNQPAVTSQAAHSESSVALSENGNGLS